MHGAPERTPSPAVPSPTLASSPGANGTGPAGAGGAFSRRAIAFLTGGCILAAAAFLDKYFGLVRQPLLLATLSVLVLGGLVGLMTLRGLRRASGLGSRIAPFAGLLLLNGLAAGYVWAWRQGLPDPTPVVLQRELDEGDALLREGREDEAALIYQTALRRYPRSFGVLIRMGSVNYRIGFYDRAERYFARALEVAPRERRWEALKNLGQTYWKQRKPELAIEYCERAREEGLPDSGPDLIEWHYLLGWAYFDVRNYDRAIEHYRAVALAGKKYAEASYYNVACAQAQKLASLPPGESRERLVREAVENLKQAWALTTDPEEKAALREGLAGTPDQLDPELEPLRASAAYRAFVRGLPAPQPSDEPPAP